jgi:CheY-like chemotaxis protein
MGKRVLVVEDNEDIALVVKTTLRLRDYEVETAFDGLLGLAAARSAPYDLIILDVLMPEMDGFQVLEALKADESTASVPVVLFTANLTSADRQMAMDGGAAGVLIKPFDPMTFIREVGVFVGEA